MRRKNSAPGTHNDGHHQQQQPQRVLQPRVSAHRTTLTHTAAGRFTVVSPRTLHRTSPRTAGESFVAVSTAGQTRRHVQLPGKNLHSSQAPLMTHHISQLLHAANTTTAAIPRDTRRAHALPPRKSRRNQNLVRAFFLHAAPQRVQHGVCVCLAAPIHAEQLCATRESEESNGRERQIAHTQITHIITHTHTQPRNGCTQPQNQKGKQNKKTKRGTTSAHTLSLLP
ncbi:hypothetical protein TCDM_13102 [Trypanosoma cruzi Dm28c]|uniref:Uncharacterized protein n=1 Tax=Trypanosoma cruzi Dm28c TaxID=1416333 RepID=V5AJI5_TRYCR|nr:hypothetical protein TCDM_13102 [Trypanosoma cruzi Dm28c]